MKLRIGLCILLSLNICVFADDYYELLGVTRNADTKEIRKAFKKLALTHHPDKNKDDPKAHENFLKINKAYEVLKDPDKRRKYDSHGEAGLKDDFSDDWGGNFHSWNYYYESFGIYDDDPEIVTLSRNDFDHLVHDSGDLWFINFYSPHCSHCHHLAPTWRKLAQSFEGVIRIGAVNCEEDWSACTDEGIRSYPSLIFYPDREKYTGQRNLDDLEDYILRKLPKTYREITDMELEHIQEDLERNPLIVVSCTSNINCLNKNEIWKLSAALEGLAKVRFVRCDENPQTCKKLDTADGVYYIRPGKDVKQVERIDGSDAIELRQIILKRLPGLESVTSETFNDILKSDVNGEEESWLLVLNKGEELQDSIELELKHIKGLIPFIKVGYIDCNMYYSACSHFSADKFPSYVVLRSGGKYEYYHGRITARDLANFVRESIASRVETLKPSDFEDRILRSGTLWVVDFFTPWCPPCLQLLPELRKTSRFFENVSFGTIDCVSHSHLCSNYKINSYPTTVFYNTSSTAYLSGFKSSEEINEFIENILDPKVISLTPENFEELVMNKNSNEIWAIDFYAPWCGPCRELTPEWHRFGKLMSDDANFKIAEVNCELYRSLCSEQNVRSYPNLRIYPMGGYHSSKYSTFNGWNRDSFSFRKWALTFLPSDVEELLPEQFYKTVLQDSQPWLVDFYAPWCGHCVTFRPAFEEVARKMKDKLNFGAINCEDHWQACESAGVRSYPTVLFYSGAQGVGSQSPEGYKISSQNSQKIERLVEKLIEQSRTNRLKDEL